jgi:uncharacterized ubiquitin-like protein YukD
MLAEQFLVENYNPARFTNYGINVIRSYIRYLNAQIDFMLCERETLKKYIHLNSDVNKISYDLEFNKITISN